MLPRVLGGEVRAWSLVPPVIPAGPVPAVGLFFPSKALEKVGKGLPFHGHPCSSKCGPHTSSFSITWGLGGNANSQVSLAESESLGVGLRGLCFNSLPQPTFHPTLAPGNSYAHTF